MMWLIYPRYIKNYNFSFALIGLSDGLRFASSSSIGVPSMFIIFLKGKDCQWYPPTLLITGSVKCIYSVPSISLVNHTSMSFVNILPFGERATFRLPFRFLCEIASTYPASPFLLVQFVTFRTYGDSFCVFLECCVLEMSIDCVSEQCPYEPEYPSHINSCLSSNR